jgi:hypothetical protein
MLLLSPLDKRFEIILAIILVSKGLGTTYLILIALNNRRLLKSIKN